MTAITRAVGELVKAWIRRWLGPDPYQQELYESAAALLHDFPYVRDGSTWLGLDREVGDPWLDRHAAWCAVARGDSAPDTLEYAKPHPEPQP